MLSPVSIQTFEFNNDGFVIRVEDDKISITKDGETNNVYFNCLYNKNEIDNLIAGGGGADPDYLRNICITAVNMVLAGMKTFNTVKVSDGKLNIVTKNVERASNQIYELFRWISDYINEISDAHNSLFNDVDTKDKAIWDKIKTIKECHCMDEGGFYREFKQHVVENIATAKNLYESMFNGFIIHSNTIMKMINERVGVLTLGTTQNISSVYNEAHDSFLNLLYKIWAPSNEDENETPTTATVEEVDEDEPVIPDFPVVDPSEQIVKLNIPLIDDPYKRTFDEDKPIYGTLTIPYDLQVNGLINGVDITDIQPGPGPTPGDSYFNKVNGYDYFYVKNENVDVEDFTYNYIACNKLAINGVTTSTINKLKTINDKIDVFRFMLRKNEIFDESGTFIKEFYCYVEDKKLYCPVITLSPTNDLIRYQIDYVETSWEDKPFIAFDKQISFEPYVLYLRGEISIMYLLPQDTIESKIPEIKCDIITAKNALKLHESNVAYLYKPSKINENDDYYSMTFHIDDSFSLPTNMTFTFNEFCFMNNWTLTWTGHEWIGNNIQGKSNGTVINHMNCMYEDTYAAIGIKKNEFNNYVITDLLNCSITQEDVMSSILSKYHVTINGTFDNGDDFTVTRNDLPSLQSVLKFEHGYLIKVLNHDDVYTDMVSIKLDVNYKDLSAYKSTYLDHVKEITVDLIVSEASNKFTFELTTSDPHEYAGGYELRIKPANDTIDELNVLVQKCNIDKTTKDVTLHLDKGTLRPRDEINWDGKTNPFQYIIDQQFYSITPNPNAATTLYTDFNITSSKIITADNITTMRSDLNIVANTTDVLDFDLKALEKRTDNLETEVHQVEDVVQHIQKEMKTLKIEAGFALALSVASTVLSVGNTLELAGNYISLGFGKIKNIINNGYVRVASSESGVDMNAEDLTYNLLNLNVRNALTYESSNVDLSGLMTWINSEHIKPKFSDKYASTEDDEYNPENIYISYASTHDLCIRYRDSLKPAFKLIVDKFIDEENEMKEIQNEVNEVYDLMVTKYDFIDTVNEVPEVICTKGNQRLWFRFKNHIDEGEISFRVTWNDWDSESDWDDCKISFRSTKDPKTHKRIGYEITEFTCEQESEISRFQTPVIQECNDDDAVCEIVIDATQREDPEHYGSDEFREVTNVISNVKTYKEESSFDKLVYKDDLKVLNDRVDKLEKGGNNLTFNEDIERRLAILEAKCRNIIIDEVVSVQSEGRTLTIEERLTLLERKCANMKI